MVPVIQVEFIGLSEKPVINRKRIELSLAGLIYELQREEV